MSRESEIIARFELFTPTFINERALRLYAAGEAILYGRGGVEVLHRVTGLARTTILRGQAELKIQKALETKDQQRSSGNDDSNSSEEAQKEKSRIRRPGGGRKKITALHPELFNILDKLLDPGTLGDPESSLRWTIKSTETISDELKKLGYIISPNSVMRILHESGYNLKSNAKVESGSDHPDRNEQFEYISKKATMFINENCPVISVDTKKKEILGNFKNSGQKWTAKGQVTKVNDHDFPSPDLPRALPYGIYDINNNFGHIVIGIDHDTSEFAVNSIYGWWEKYGTVLYPSAKKILITADCGGSNGYRLNLWKYSLQKFCDNSKISISVCHFPPGTSKWNKIEHRLFSFISSNWRGEPLVDYETVVKLISSTKTSTGLFVSCIIDDSKYDIGKKLTKEQILSINLSRDEFHGEWNYTISPH
jgi:hypothetical protein